jgi:GNAT superfamily N-acetyltransferase
MLVIRPIQKQDPPIISAAFDKIGWNKPIAQYQRYLQEQESSVREVLIALVDGMFAGYLTIVWEPEYEPFHVDKIPEVQDFNVLPVFRRKQIGTALMDQAEELVATRSDTVGIGVGMYSDYGNAQRLYVLRGYIPDGRGLTYKHQVLMPLERTINDDDLVLYFTKSLKSHNRT